MRSHAWRSLERTGQDVVGSWRHVASVAFSERVCSFFGHLSWDWFWSFCCSLCIVALCNGTGFGHFGGFLVFFSEGANCAADLRRRGQPDRMAALSKAPRRGPVGIYFLTRLEPFLSPPFFSDFFSQK